jgi:hypothetical protein
LDFRIRDQRGTCSLSATLLVSSLVSNTDGCRLLVFNGQCSPACRCNQNFEVSSNTGMQLPRRRLQLNSLACDRIVVDVDKREFSKPETLIENRYLNFLCMHHCRSHRSRRTRRASTDSETLIENRYLNMHSTCMHACTYACEVLYSTRRLADVGGITGCFSMRRNSRILTNTRNAFAVLSPAWKANEQ